MPAPALQALAKQAGKSLKDAEKYYADAKKQREKTVGTNLSSADFRQIMGVVKKRLGLVTKPGTESVEYMIEAVTSGTDPVLLLNLILGETKIRTFYDAGILHVATLDDTLVDPGIDSRVDTILHMTNEVDWPHDHPLSDFECEGNLDDIYNKVLDLSCAKDLSIKKRAKRGTSRTTQQRTGDRKAQRTKLRRP